MRGTARRLLAVTGALLALGGLGAAPAGAVVGGRPASEPYPWMASLQSEGSHFCGASLVRPGWALTAAHCVQDERAKDLTVVLGRTDLTAGGGEEIGVRSIVEHDRFRKDPAGGHDVALLELARPSSAALLDLVRLDQADLWAAGRPARVIGWGTSVYLVGPPSDTLMEADVEMISDADCRTAYGTDGFDATTQVCAGRRIVGLVDSCQGDSGGPLVVRDGSGAWRQVGVVSQGLGCGVPLFYGVYARIGAPRLHEWIARRLDGAPAPGPADGGSGVSGGPASSARLRHARRLARARGALVLRVSSDRRLTNLRAVLRRGSRPIARGGLALLERRGSVRLALPAGRSVRAGRMRVRLRATDPAGRTVRRSGTVRLPAR